MPFEKATCARLLSRFQDPYLSHGDVLELGGQGENPEQFDLAQGGLEQLVVGLNGVIGDIVVAGDAAQLRDLRATRRERSHLRVTKSEEQTKAHPFI